ELALARGVLQAFERRDLDWLVERSTPDVELHPLMWTDKPFRGTSGMEAFVEEYLAVRTPLKIDVERVRQAADPVALDVRVRGHLHLSHADFDEQATFVLWIRDGRLARYEEYVDGKPRYDGVRSFLDARGIELPEGAPDDPPDRETVCGLGNRKNELVLEMIRADGVDPYPGSVRYLEAAVKAGLRRAVVS